MPALLCALAGTVLAVGLDMMKIFSSAAQSLASYWESAPFYLVEPFLVRSEIHWVLAFFISWGVTGLTLSSAATWRRVLVGLMLLSVLITLSPVFALWGILWLPMVTGIAALWSWGCAVAYAAQHRLPCEESCELAVVVNDPKAVKMKLERVALPTKKKVK